MQILLNVEELTRRERDNLSVWSYLEWGVIRDSSLCCFATSMESLHFPHFEPKHSQVYVALFRGVSNSAALKSRIVAAATAEGDHGDKEREAVNFAFVDARLVRRNLFNPWNSTNAISEMWTVDH